MHRQGFPGFLTVHLGAARTQRRGPTLKRAGRQRALATHLEGLVVQGSKGAKGARPKARFPWGQGVGAGRGSRHAVHGHGVVAQFQGGAELGAHHHGLGAVVRFGRAAQHGGALRERRQGQGPLHDALAGRRPHVVAGQRAGEHLQDHAFCGLRPVYTVAMPPVRGRAFRSTYPALRISSRKSCPSGNASTLSGR